MTACDLLGFAVYGERPFYDPENSERLTQRRERLEAEGGVNGGVNGGAYKTKEVTLNN